MHGCRVLRETLPPPSAIYVGGMTAPRGIHRVLLVHPSGLMYSEVYLRLEPLEHALISNCSPSPLPSQR